MRRPSESLVVDANIILSAVLGFRARPVLEQVGARRALVISSRASEEVGHVLSRIAPDTPDLIGIATELLEAIDVVDVVRYEDRLDVAARSLRSAPASRNGSDKDAHILALAWTYDADIWSHDRDFAGTGWPSWSSANLAAALAGEPASPNP